VALIQTKKNIIDNNFKTKHKEPLKYAIGNIQPPKNKITMIADIKIILEYSAKKNNVKPIAEYSTL
jgi:hypothetical protein